MYVHTEYSVCTYPNNACTTVPAGPSSSFQSFAHSSILRPAPLPLACPAVSGRLLGQRVPGICICICIAASALRSHSILFHSKRLQSPAITMADMAMDDCDEPIGSHHRTRTNDSHHQPGSELEANAAAATVHVQPTAPPSKLLC